MMQLALWPFVFILLILCFLLWQRHFHKVVQPKQAFTFIVSYIGLLAVCAIIVLLLQPGHNVNEEPRAKPVNVLDMPSGTYTLRLLEPHVKKEWEMTLKGDAVKLTVKHNDRFNPTLIPVIVMEDETAAGTVNVKHYETPSVIAGVDVSGHIKLPDVIVEEGEIVVDFSRVHRSYDFRIVDHVFAWKQFTEDGLNGEYYDIHIGDTVIGLKVPKGTAIASDIRHFHIVKLDGS